MLDGPAEAFLEYTYRCKENCAIERIASRYSSADVVMGLAPSVDPIKVDLPVARHEWLPGINGQLLGEHSSPTFLHFGRELCGQGLDLVAEGGVWLGLLRELVGMLLR